ncbi:MAG: aminotransferase class III-fold pyridoxal phosphate-dependent enzyme, partial [Planctomycetales bacterium]|nr:aminotransferase class III-fold pyridoxal phosphate-dependent enzyme [Planctomycetales bacterium]
MPKELASSPPLITTELPGPNSARLIAEDERYTSPSYTRVYPLVVRRAQGAMIEDMDGNRFLDFTAGIAVCATGHCHPRVVQAIREQSERLLHMSGTDFYYQPQSDLARKLVQITPGNGPKRVFFTNSGAESVEAAFKLARYHTRRPHVIAFFGAFHGRTMGALSLTGSKTRQRAGFAPLVPEVSHVDFPDCYQCPRRTTNDSCCWKTFEQIEDDLFRRTVSPDEVAAFFVEPIQGEGGYIVPPHDFHVRLKRLAEQHGILFIADEVQSGMGRTGRMFAMEHWGVEPDIMCLAKGIASGMPLGAIVAKEEVMNWPPGSHASTFGGNPISCVAAL